MTHKPTDDDDASVPGGHAAERLREFIDQRFPGGMPLPEGAQDEQDREPAADSADPSREAENPAATTGQGEESQ